jgi:hypothetical protein
MFSVVVKNVFISSRLFFADHAHREHHQNLMAQADPLRFASGFTFHAVNLPEATLSKREAGKFPKNYFAPEPPAGQAANIFHP